MKRKLILLLIYRFASQMDFGLKFFLWIKRFQKPLSSLSVIWQLWKTKCNFIFKCSTWNPFWITSQALDHTREYTKTTYLQREIFFLNCSNVSSSTCYLFIDSSWLPNNFSSGAGFILTKTNKQVIMVGCIKIESNSIVEAELCALKAGLKVAKDWEVNIHFIFTDCKNLANLFND